MHGFREWMNENPTIVGAVVVVLMIGALFFSIRKLFSSASGQQLTQAYYYDLTTQELFTDAVDRISPFTNDNGNLSVRAQVFSCSDCTTDKQFIGYLERTNESMRAQMEALRDRAARGEYSPEHEDVMGAAFEYSADMGATWISGEHESIGELFANPGQRCQREGGRVRRCLPGR